MRGEAAAGCERSRVAARHRQRRRGERAAEPVFQSHGRSPFWTSFESSKSRGASRCHANSSSSLFSLSMPAGVARSRSGSGPSQPRAVAAARAGADRRCGLPRARLEHLDGRAVEHAQRVHQELERCLRARRDALLARRVRRARSLLIRARVARLRAARDHAVVPSSVTLPCAPAPTPEVIAELPVVQIVQAAPAALA